jgi:hypothetical protein
MSFISRFSRGNPVGCALLAGACLFAGYLDLWRGGTSLAAALLTGGYLVLVPVAIRAWYLGRHGTEPARPVQPATPAESPPYAAAIVLSLAVFVLYALTLAPSTAMWDASEYIAVARVLGLPHPPGNPMFVLIAHTFALLPIPVSYAERVNLLAATTSAISAGFWFLITHRALRGAARPRAAIPGATTHGAATHGTAPQGTGMPPLVRIAAAAAAAWIGATAFSVWNQSVVNEKVYTVALLGVAVVAWLALRWFDAPAASRKADFLLVTIAYLCGIGYANHPAGFLPLPAVGLFILLRRPGTLLRPRLLAAAAFALVLGLTPFAFEPIRASHNPPINEGEPTACVGGPRVGCILSAVTWQRLGANIRREQYGGHAVTTRRAPLSAQAGMWWLYFEWQWWRDPFHTARGVQAALALTFLLLAALGAVTHWRTDRDSFCFIAPLLVTLTPLLIVYLNFEYGWSQAPELGDTVPREVRDRDYFYVWSFASLAVWIGIGIAAVWQRAAALLARPLAGDTAASPPRVARGWALAAPVLLVALIPFAGNVRHAPRSDHGFTAAWARDLLASVEPYAILVTNGDNDSFPLWYAQQVEGVRRDVSVVLTPYLGTDWYVRQLLRARVDQYDGTGLPGYAEHAVPQPTTSPLSLADAEADAIPPYIETREPQEFRHGNIVAAVEPGILTRDQLLVLRLIADTFPARPIYFSLGNYPQALGLGDHIVTQGLAQRLTDQPARGLPGVVSLGGRHVDSERSRALWDAYEAPGALHAERDWVDDASIVIPSAYVATGELLARSLALRGDSASAKRVFSETLQLARKLRLIPRTPPP